MRVDADDVPGVTLDPVIYRRVSQIPAGVFGDGADLKPLVGRIEPKARNENGPEGRRPRPVPIYPTIYPANYPIRLSRYLVVTSPLLLDT